MDNCILFGNGINRCYNTMSWNDLLIEIANSHFVSKDTVNSNTLAFDQLMCSILSIEYKTKSDESIFNIVNKLDDKELRGSITYKNFLDLGINTILTTNFDYAIERAINSSFSSDKCKRMYFQETKCSNKRHVVVDDYKVFHIHGELGLKDTICLGNVHYLYNLNRIMDSLLEKNNKDEFHLLEKVFDDELLSWAQFLFKDNIFIVGLGLYDCDLDLWWSITYRAQQLYYGNEKIKNHIVFYYLFEKKDQTFVDCLKAMQVDVRELEVQNSNWIEAYESIVNNIKTTMESFKLNE